MIEGLLIRCEDCGKPVNGGFMLCDDCKEEDYDE